MLMGICKEFGSRDATFRMSGQPKQTVCARDRAVITQGDVLVMDVHVHSTIVKLAACIMRVPVSLT
jgi:hypothetical protein